MVRSARATAGVAYKRIFELELERLLLEIEHQHSEKREKYSFEAPLAVGGEVEAMVAGAKIGAKWEITALVNCECGLPGRYQGKCIYHCDISKVSSSTLLGYVAVDARMAEGILEFIVECEGAGGADPQHRKDLRKHRRRVERLERELRSRPSWRT